jgi:HlyD family secretion protein
MSSRIFRDVSLERLSSPDQLDSLLKVTDSKNWLSQFALFGLLALSILWSYRGSLPTVVSGQGVIIRKGGILNVVSVGSGVLEQMYVEVGDKVKAHQLLAKVAQPAMQEKIRNARQTLDDARREKDRAHGMLQDQAKLGAEAIQRKRTNADREIANLEQQISLAKEQVNAQDALFADGIVTKQKTIEARQNVASLEAQIANLQAQIKELNADEFNAQAKIAESDAANDLRIQDRERELHELETQLELAENVLSPYDGEVLEIKASSGSTLVAGEPLLSVQNDTQDIQVLVYVSAEQAKNIRDGMEARIMPSTVKPEEYGFIKGNVTYISDFPDTPAELMRNFENEVLVKALTQEGPVTELRITMQKNPTTPSGYQWSSPKGPGVAISGGTLCAAEIITRRQAPITLVLPFLKKNFGLT